ncbi:hypothetical protein BDM02DRAFT_3175491 [Thelephora ganbajun]|uniref:Uncharacterized protein n=1 Tax=Thelephora ganbajun TaxID=370292 RepID=A0ACB6Z2B0_THEGA|nr:hypothetical protein BDM02DRAFT_3175491 [Thelephora ganbajun]
MTEAGPSKSPVSSNPKSHFDSLSSNSSKHVQLGVGLGPPPAPSRRRAQDAENGFTTRNNRRKTHFDPFGRGHGEEGPAPVTKPRPSMKYEMHPAQLLEADANITAFSDEYDLAHEDPAILADVQRAVKMKARREARLKAPGPIRTETSPQSFFSTSSSQSRAPLSPGASIAFPSINSADAAEDFVASLDASVPHPMPRSPDNGATLDWSGKEVAGEPRHDRKWSLSINKRKTKGKATSISSLDHSPIDNSRDSNYDERVARIRACMKPQALRKASVAAEHIQRRYSFLYASLFPPSRPLNPLSIVRWNAEQDSAKSNLHTRSLWHITPSIVEEYLKVQAHQEEEPTTNLDLLLPSPIPNSTSPKSEEEIYPLRYPGVQTAVSRTTREMTASPVSDNWPSDSPRPWISSPQSDNDSPRSSLYSAFRGALGHVSPASSKRHIWDRTTKRLSGDSAHASLSETNSRAGSASPSKSRKQARLRTPNLDTKALHTSGPESDGGEQHAMDMRSPQLSESLLTAKPPDSAILSAGTITKSADPTAVPPIRRPLLIRRRVSLPLADYRLSVEVEKRRQLADEEREQYEYEIRAQLLDEAVKQNSRIRQQLQRITAEFRDFTHVQKQLIELLNMPFPTVPPEVFDVISRDPAAMTGQTRRLKGWRVVEEAYCRINKQREMLSGFAAAMAEINKQLPQPRGIFDESLIGLMDSLSQLEHHREDLRKKESEATQKLAHVRELHVLTKMEFNDTLGHTSHIYPELSLISALEEKYRNRYQKFWDIGMDALTFLLDSITPFWRSYGKTIGIDIQDFLIIPWYRNEFTGHPKRYPITSLPKRSFRHWLGLLLFAIGCHALLFLQIGSAMYTTTNGFLFLYGQNPGVSIILLPCMIAACIVMWVAVICEFSIIVAQIGVVLWWLGWSVGIFS